MLSAGVLGETALPGFRGVTVLNDSIGPDAGRGATEGWGYELGKDEAKDYQRVLIPGYCWR
jgi:hypothetical protein